MYLSPPDVHCLGPIKMELSEPQANLQAALHVLELHHSKLNTTKVNNKRAALHFFTRETWAQTEISVFGQRFAFDECIKFFTLFLHCKLPCGTSKRSLNTRLINLSFILKLSFILLLLSKQQYSSCSFFCLSSVKVGTEMFLSLIYHRIRAQELSPNLTQLFIYLS